MPAEARISSIWKKQKLFVSLFLMAIGAWFFWDGFIGYPRSNERWEGHQQHLVEGRIAEWPDYAKSRGWVETPPHKLFKKSDIVGQFIFGGIGALLGVIVFIYWATQKNQTIRSDENAVYTPRGTTVPYSGITGLGKKRWDSKGIAVVRYEIDGRKGQFLLDDYKFDAEPTRRILEDIEAKLRARGEEPPREPPAAS